MINIQSFAKAKNNSKSTSSKGFSGAVIGTKIQEHKLWGQPFDGTQDVDGDINTSGRVIADGNIVSKSDLKAGGNLEIVGNGFINGSVTANGGLQFKGDLTTDGNVSVKGNITSDANITGKNINAETVNTTSNINAGGNITSDADITATNITASANVNTNTLHIDGDTHTNGDIYLNIGDIYGEETDIYCRNIENKNNIITNAITVKNQLNAKNANIDTQLSKNITTDYLTVTKQAHFWELVVDKLSATNGAVIITPAHAKVERVEVYPQANNGIVSYQLAWRCKDDDGKEITNDFKVNDQIICHTFNVKEGTSSNVSNKYYWAVVKSVSTIERDYDNTGKTELYNRVAIWTNPEDFDGSSIPEIGDEIVLLGHRGEDKSRQNAIVLSSVKSNFLDEEVQPPSIVQYKGIKTFALAPYRYNVLAANGNKFVGKFNIITEGGIEELTNTNVIKLVPDYLQAFVDVKEDNLEMYIKVGVQKNNEILTDLSNYKLLIKDGLNADITLTATSDKFELYKLLQTNYSQQQNKITSIILFLQDENNNVVDQLTFNVSFESKALFDIKQDAIEAAVTSSKGYTDNKVSSLKIDTDKIATRVSDIENDYVTGSQLTLESTNIALNVFKDNNKLRNMVVGSAYRDLDEYKSRTANNSNQTVTIFSGTNPNNYPKDNNNFVRFNAQNQTGSTFTGLDLNIAQLKPNTKYIVSFWVRVNKACDNSSFCRLVYNTDTINRGTLFNIEFPNTNIGKWVKYETTFTVPNGVTEHFIENRVRQNGIIDMCQIMIEEGTTYKGWTLSPYDVGVTDALKKTGIDIETGKITLNADDTTIRGNLNLNDTENGLTVFDKDNRPAINMQPKNINEFAEMKDMYVLFTNRNGNQNTVIGNGSNTTTTKYYLNYLYKNDILKIDNIVYQCWSVPKSSAGVSDNDTYIKDTFGLAATLIIYNGNTVYKRISFNKSRKIDNSTWEMNLKQTIKIESSGAYYIQFYISVPTYFNSTRYVNFIVDGRYQVGMSLQSFLGTDGVLFHNAPNVAMSCTEQEMMFKHAFNGISWSDYYGLSTVGNKTMNTIVDIAGQINNVTYPHCVPFYNYTPTTVIKRKDYTLKTITVLNNNTSVWCHTINPNTDVGIIVINEPYIGTGAQESYIELPPVSYEVKISPTQQMIVNLPVGYTVHIVNVSKVFSTSTVNIHISPKADAGKGRIYTTQTGWTSKYTQNVLNKSYMYLGTDSGGNVIWTLL